MHGQRTASLLVGLLAGYFFSRRILDRRAVEEALTDRQRDVLRAVAAGRTTKEIATELGITERTARTHVSNILGKLELQSRTQAALYAVERKLVPDR